MPSAGYLQTPLARRLGLELPLIQAPMAGWTTPHLVAAVAAAGGLGMLPAARTTPQALQSAIDSVRSLTDQPFGVNFLLSTPEGGQDIPAGMRMALDRVRVRLGLPVPKSVPALPPSDLEEQLDLVERARVPVVTFGMGNPGPLAERFREAGAVTMGMITSVTDAVAIVESGIDVVIAQGSEAGGHRSTFPGSRPEQDQGIGIAALVPAIADAVEVPVVAAGGIVDGRGLTAALALGAEAVQIGTRFLLAVESGASPATRARLRSMSAEDTRITRSLTGRPARALTSPLLHEIEAAGAQPGAWPYQALAADDIYRAAADRDDPDYMPLLAGQGIGRFGDAPAAEIVRTIVEESRIAIARLASFTPT